MHTDMCTDMFIDVCVVMYAATPPGPGGVGVGVAGRSESGGSGGTTYGITT